jgi:hypothetical protein
MVECLAPPFLKVDMVEFFGSTFIKGRMSEIIELFKENYLAIATIIFVILGLLVVISVREIELNPPKPESKLVQEITVETFSTQENTEKLKMQPSESFCDSYLGNSQELEPACNRLTESNCNQTRCCVYAKSATDKAGKCVAGDLHGPTYKTDKDGKLITIDSYYYLGKRFTTM